MKHAFDTKRLRVFRAALKPTPHNSVRILYVAFRLDEDRPMVCATCLVWLAAAYVDWIEVTSEYRRMGFASELLKGIEADLGTTLDLSPGSDEGEAFCPAYEAIRSDARDDAERACRGEAEGDREGRGVIAAALPEALSLKSVAFPNGRAGA